MEEINPGLDLKEMFGLIEVAKSEYQREREAHEEAKRPKWTDKDGNISPAQLEQFAKKYYTDRPLAKSTLQVAKDENGWIWVELGADTFIKDWLGKETKLEITIQDCEDIGEEQPTNTRFDEKLTYVKF
jgi:hypothetical protein